MGNWTHLFVDGHRVSVDARDDSVTYFPDEGFRWGAARGIGRAVGAGHRWTATAPGGAEHSFGGRKAAVEWLIEETSESRSKQETSRTAEREASVVAANEALTIIRTVRPDYPAPGPLMGSEDAPTYFVFEPEELRDMLSDLVGR